MIDWTDLWTAGGEAVRPHQPETLLRSAISRLYYSVFHRLTAAGGALISGATPALQAQTARAFNHAQMARVCDAYARPPQLRAPTTLDTLVPVRSPALTKLCIEFPGLQSARQRADYDLTSTVTFDEAADVWESAARAHEACSTAETSPEAATFLTALLLHDKWTRRG